ncbi:hypothetical protein FACS1894169_01740 [Bacteroidia bacterium]|nr:hypothetical protein FACS1894169_01740 [Bacteroidia bacterium]
MKKIKYMVVLGCILMLGMISCNDWLDVNTDPDNPNNETALLANRLPWIQKFYQYSAGVTNMRTSCQSGVYYSNSANNTYLAVTWACQPGSTTTSYQTWFVAAAANLNDMYNTAQKQGAYHYMAAADVMHALGFMEMLDLYGEIPYTEALGASVSPAYDDGKTVFEGCIAKLDEAIELFGKAQESGAEQFSAGDMWNGGNVNKWLKLSYGLKARYLLKLSKKAEFSPDALLDCLSKAPQSNADNTVAVCYNKKDDVTDYLFGDPIMTNGNFDYVAWGSNQRISKYYYDLLTNMRGSGVEDPRMSKIVPAMMVNMKLSTDGKVMSYEWLRSKGVDFYGPSERLLKGGATSIALYTYADKDTDVKYSFAGALPADRTAFINGLNAGNYNYTADADAVTVTYPKGSHFINNGNYILAGDTVYVNLRQYSTLTGGSDEMDMNWYASTSGKSAGAVASTGSFQIRPNSDQEILTYHEMCFIKAEVYMRKGEKANALTAYKDGIKAHMDMMQTKLTEWQSAGYDNPDMMPMDISKMSSYLASAAVCQDAGSLTMADIMLQKYVAMGCSLENWNDMRRFNYSAGNIGSFGMVYPGYGRSPLFAGQAEITGTTPTDPTYWMRRWRMPNALELQYNTVNAMAANKHAMDLNIWCYPVWWDCATDDEYNNYIK